MLAQARGKRDLPQLQPTGGVVADMALRIWGLRYLFGWMGVRPATPANIKEMFAEGFKAS